MEGKDQIGLDYMFKKSGRLHRVVFITMTDSNSPCNMNTVLKMQLFTDLCTAANCRNIGAVA